MTALPYFDTIVEAAPPSTIINRQTSKLSSSDDNVDPNTGQYRFRGSGPNRTSLPVSFGRSNLSDPFGIRAAERELNNLFGSIPGLGPSGSFRPNREANRAFGNHFGQFGVRVPNSSNPPGQSKRTTASSNTKINTTSGTGTEGRRARDEIVYPEWWTNGSPEPSEGVVLHADSSGSKDTEVLTY